MTKINDSETYGCSPKQFNGFTPKVYGCSSKQFNDFTQDYCDGSPKSDIIKPYKEKEECNMSFVIMMANRNGMACAADSRSTAGTNWFPAVESDNLTKVFKNETMLVATFGPNKVNIDSIKIEEIINDIMPISTTPFEFSENFRKRICDDKVYCFLIGWKNNIYEFKISTKEVKYFFKGKSYYCINTSELDDYIEIGFDWVSSSDVLEDKCRKVVENVIELCKKSPYSYVGGAIKSYNLSYREDDK